MKLFIVAIGMLLFLQVSSYGQEYKDYPDPKNIKIDGFRIGVVPSAMLNKWIGYQGKASYYYKDFEIECNIGYLNGSDNSEPYSGYRVRPVLKYYYSRVSNSAYYVGIGGLIRNINIDAQGTFGRFNNSFFQEADFKIEQRMKGFYGMVGVLFPLSNERFYFDIGTGIGRSFIDIDHIDIPDNSELNYSPPFFTKDTRSAGRVDYPIFFIHFAIMYQF